MRVVDPYAMDELAAIIREELDAPEPSVIIARRPCALLKSVKAEPPLSVSAEACKSCKKCMDIGCPAIRFEVLPGEKHKKAAIDQTLCIGCGLCLQMCRYGAIERREG